MTRSWRTIAIQALLFVAALLPIIQAAESSDNKETTQSKHHVIETPAAVPFTKLPIVGAFVASWSMILVSEIGDKTFFIAAIMAMKQSRWEIFSSAMSALILMTVLSAMMGLTLPHLLDPQLTAMAATVLFFFFGCKLLYDTYMMDPASNGAKEEMEEVEDELEKSSADTAALLMEAGQSMASAKTRSSKIASVVKHFVSPVFIQCFTMTFLAEWGDRSQIATIALAAAKDPVGVSLGAIVGHSMCTGLAVLGGKLLASRISERTISGVGGCLFLVFAIHSIVFRD